MWLSLKRPELKNTCSNYSTSGIIGRVLTTEHSTKLEQTNIEIFVFSSFPTFISLNMFSNKFINLTGFIVYSFKIWICTITQAKLWDLVFKWHGQLAS